MWQRTDTSEVTEDVAKTDERRRKTSQGSREMFRNVQRNVRLEKRQEKRN